MQFNPNYIFRTLLLKALLSLMVFLTLWHVCKIKKTMGLWIQTRFIPFVVSCKHDKYQVMFFYSVLLPPIV